MSNDTRLFLRSREAQTVIDQDRAAKQNLLALLDGLAEVCAALQDDLRRP